MGNWKQKKFNWQVRKAKKNAAKSKVRKGKQRSLGEHVVKKPRRKVKVYHAVAPNTFSFISESNATYTFFDGIINEILEKNFGEIFYINLIGVNRMTVDVIMYLLAVMKNIKGREGLKYSFKGNRPTNVEANRLFVESGFYRYVKLKTPYLYATNEHYQIVDGTSVSGEVAGNICDFVNSAFGTSIRFTSELYEVIIELMTNTVQHAYNGNDILMLNHWYFYARACGEKIYLVFLDTGKGIPQTVHKKAIEKFGELLADSYSDPYYLNSALQGEWRSKTVKKYRGRGLPSIVDYAKRKEVSEFTIVTGGAKVRLGSRGIEESIDTGNKLFGTLYSWAICKDILKEE